jgi:drug/metabolite transporter (DMT)-like permease
MRLQLPLFICLIAGLFMAVQYFMPAALPAYNRMNDYLQIVYAFSIVLGVASVVHRHGGRLRRLKKDWPYSLAAIASMVLMLAAGFIGGRGRESLFQQLFNAILLPVQATMFALLAFYLASASFRAFRTRSLDATVLLISAVIVMIGRLDDGQTLHIPDVSRWILNSPNLVAKRAILIGVGLGMASTALKVVLGIERSYLGSGKE